MIEISRYMTWVFLDLEERCFLEDLRAGQCCERSPMSDYGEVALLVASSVEPISIITHPDVASFACCPGNSKGEALQGCQTPVPVASTDLNKLIESWEIHGDYSAFGDLAVRDPLVVCRENSLECFSKIGHAALSVVAAEGSVPVSTKIPRARHPSNFGVCGLNECIEEIGVVFHGRTRTVGDDDEEQIRGKLGDAKLASERQEGGVYLKDQDRSFLS